MTAAATTGDEHGTVASFRRLIRQRRRPLITIAALSLVGGFAEALSLVLIVRIGLSLASDDLSPQELSFGGLDLQGTSSLLILAASALALKAVMQLLAVRKASQLSTSVMLQVRADAVAGFLRAEWPTQVEESAGNLQTLAVNFAAKASYLLNNLATGIAALLNVVALIISAFVLSPSAALAIFVGLLGLFLALKPVTRYTNRYAKVSAQADKAYARDVELAVELALEARVFGVQEEVRGQVAGSAQRSTEALERSVFVSRLLSPLYQSVAMLIVLAGLAAIFYSDVGQVESLSALLLIIIRSLIFSQQVQMAYNGMAEQMRFFDEISERISHYDDHRVVDEGQIDEPIGTIVLDGVGYTYPDGSVALEGIDIHVEPGSLIGIIGPSGSGKSTLLQLLLRLREPTAGRFLVGGRPAWAHSMASWQHRVAYVPQEAHLFDGTVADNIRFHRRHLTDAQVAAAAARAMIEPSDPSWTEGLDTAVGERGRRLSGGQRQRVTIARALVGDPDVLVLDEPTSALDLEAEAVVQKTITNLKGTVTTFVVAHRMSTVRACDKLLVILDGRMEAFASHGALNQESGFYRRVIELSDLREEPTGA